MSVLTWLRARDNGLAALRRAGRTAIVMPAAFALGNEVIGNPTLAFFAAFGSFAQLLLVDFPGPVRDRVQAQAALAAVGAVFVAVGTLASNSTWLAAASMMAVGFGVLFAGVVSSVLAGATTSLLLAFILPVSLPGPASSIPDRLAGWGIASGAALLAIALLWPAPARDPVRGAVIAACRALAARLRSEVALAIGGESRPSPAEHEAAVAAATGAVDAMQAAFVRHPVPPDRARHRREGRRPARGRAEVAGRDPRLSRPRHPVAMPRSARAAPGPRRRRCSSVPRSCWTLPPAPPTRSREPLPS